MDEITFADCEDRVDELTKVPETPEEEAFSQAQMAAGLIPNLEGLRQMRWGLNNLKKVLITCPGPPQCTDHECVGKPEHQAQYSETIRPVIERLESQIDELKRESAHWLYKYMNCRCTGCLTQGKINAAPFN